MIADQLTMPPASCVVYTPSPLAEAIIGALEVYGGERWLEPSCGNGVFLRAIRKRWADAVDITGVDIAREVNVSTPGVNILSGIDFLSWAQDCSVRYDRIVGNPPYFRIRELSSPLREAASAVVQPNGQPVGVRANCWYSFLCASLGLLSPGGGLAFVLPAAWDYADYALPAREGISQWFRSVRVYRCLGPLFDGVDDGVVVLIAEGWQNGPCEVFRSEYKSSEDLVAALANSVGDNASGSCGSSDLLLLGQRKRLGDVMAVRIGAVTGDSRFFVISESQRRKLKIPVRACRPALTKNRHLVASSIDERVWARLRDEDEKVWLFHPSESLAVTPSVRAYLDLPAKSGGCRKDAYKVANREPWYKTPLPPAPDAFLSGHSPHGIWLAFKGMPRLTATNTLYGVRFRTRLSTDGMSAWALSILCTDVYQQWLSRLRIYPAGLRKIEPGDLAEISLPVPLDSEGATALYSQAVEALLNGDSIKARRIADTWLERAVIKAR